MANVKFGFYHVAPEINEENFQRQLKCDYTSVFILEGTKTTGPNGPLARVAAVGKAAWIGVASLCCVTRSTATIADVGDAQTGFTTQTSYQEGWQDHLRNLVQEIRSDGTFDAFLGIYFDEPFLWNMSHEMLEEITGFFRRLCPEKGVFICFSIAGVAPDVWTINDIQPITPKAGRFITDVAFDMYHPFDETYAHVSDEMVERMGNRTDLRYWFIPCTMNYRGDKDVAHCIRHLEGCAGLLRRFPPEQRGGLMCFSYYTFPPEVEDLGNVCLDVLLDPKSEMYWPELGSAIEGMGRAIAAGEFDQ
jgi:hypothetical protein